MNLAGNLEGPQVEPREVQLARRCAEYAARLEIAEDTLRLIAQDNDAAGRLAREALEHTRSEHDNVP